MAEVARPQSLYFLLLFSIAGDRTGWPQIGGNHDRQGRWLGKDKLPNSEDCDSKFGIGLESSGL
jgi:hypothetical protein